jgi:LytS/YehU family sensor histidine kinase
MFTLIGMEYLAYGYRFRKQNSASLAAILCLMVLGTVFQEAVSSSLRTAYLGLTLGLAMLFIHNTEYSQLDADDRLKEQRFRILMSQIKPHFLYNTLGAIQELCMSDPHEAMLAISTFSRYLRGNMDSLSESGLIPFEKELEHTKLYLQLEKMRFEDALQIEYDIRCTEFDVPSLTLQPIAENAVRHGARGKPQPVGKVKISAEETEDKYVITIEDNGPGFNAKKQAQKDDDRSHVGIENVRERLHSMCEGKLLYDSVPGRGTKAFIIIPKG